MTIEQARAILDAVRAGVDYPEHVISQALVATGDLGYWCRERRAA